MEKPGFNTKCIHGKRHKKDVHNAISFPIYSGVAFDFDSAEELENAFAGRKPAHAYSRITNPTVEAFEQTMTALENGLGSIAVSSGMAAISNVFLCLLEQGDHVISSVALFGGTYSLLEKTLKPFGIGTSFVDINDLDEVRNAITDKTRIIFFETISNPKMSVPDVEALTKLAREHSLVVVVDSTMTTPYLFDAKAHGVNIVVHSTTKFISGGATSVGGAIVDMGNYDWTSNQALGQFHRLKHWALIGRLRSEVYRDIGSCLSPFHAYLQSLGLETLSIRVDKCCDNTMKIAEFLEQNDKVISVSYPGLASSPYHDLARKQFKDRFGAVLSFELEDKKAAFDVLNKFEIIRRATNLGDNKTLAIHPASTIFIEYSPEERLSMGVPEGMIRLSVGLEDSEDLIRDISQALV